MEPTRRLLVLTILMAGVQSVALASEVSAALSPSDPPPFAAIYAVPGPSGGRLRGYVAQFTPRGPIAGTIQPAIVPFNHVAVDPRGPTYYGGFSWHSGEGAVRLDPVTGAAIPLLSTDPELTSWPTGLTFDTTRNRLIASTLGGEGFLFAYSPEQARWSRLASLRNIDLHSVTYSAADDSLYALTRNTIVRYTPQGQPNGSLRLDPTLPSGLDLTRSQLVATGDQLVLLTQPVNDPLEPRLPAVQRSYLIDPRSGLMTALGPIQVVPEPSAALLGVGVIGIALWRRRRKA